MACCYCGNGQPLIRGVGQNGHVELTFIDKQNQFCYYEQNGTNPINNYLLIAFQINFCPYCGQKLEERISVPEQWWVNPDTTTNRASD